jgi:hypothetical protein
MADYSSLLMLSPYLSTINALLALLCAFGAFEIAAILSDKKILPRIKAGYFLSIDRVVLSWKLIAAAVAVFALQYLATTLFLLGVYKAETAFVLLAMYFLEACFIALLSAGILVSYKILKKYAG